MGMSRGKSAHPRTMYKEINLNELICHISLGRGRHSGRDFGPALHTETEERNLHCHHYIKSHLYSRTRILSLPQSQPQQRHHRNPV